MEQFSSSCKTISSNLSFNFFLSNYVCLQAFTAPVDLILQMLNYIVEVDEYTFIPKFWSGKQIEMQKKYLFKFIHSHTDVQQLRVFKQINMNDFMERLLATMNSIKKEHLIKENVFK